MQDTLMHDHHTAFSIPMCNSVLQGHVQSGVVVTPIILYSDKTKITHDQRRSLWPVSLSIANIDRQLRGKPHGNVWLGTLPAEIGDASEGECRACMVMEASHLPNTHSTLSNAGKAFNRKRTVWCSVPLNCGKWQVSRHVWR